MTIRQKTLEQGTQVGRYRILRELGRGGMGVVYLAHDEHLDRQVALKTAQVASIGSSTEMRNQRRHRFLREVQALAQLNHENVVHVYDAGELDHPRLGWVLYYVMQYVAGITLSDLVVRRGGIDAHEAAALCTQIALGLGAGHQCGIVHRDVKPANVFLSEDSRVLIGDFGIAKLADATQITRRDQMVGTPNFLAPEQILGDEVTAATDVFALGALFYMITMKRPLRTRVDAASLIAHAQGNVARGKMLSALAVPRALRNVVARALEREPAKRYPNGQEFAEALSEFASRVPSLGAHIAADATEEEAPRGGTTTDTDTFRVPAREALPSRQGPPEEADRGDGDERPVPVAIAGASSDDHAGETQHTSSAREMGPQKKQARTETTVVFNMRNLSLPEEMDFSGLEEELPTLTPSSALDTSRTKELPRGDTTSDELYLLRAALNFVENLTAQSIVVPTGTRLPLPPASEEIK